MRTVSRLFTMALVLSALVLIARPAFAVKPLLPLLCKAFDLKEEEASCKYCHTFDKSKNEKPSEHNTNAFAQDFKSHPEIRKIGEIDNDHKFNDAEKAAVLKIFNDIARFDSDGDGASNIEELKLGSNPGDAQKKPDAAELAKYRKDHPDTTPIPKPAGYGSGGKKREHRRKDD